MNDYLMPREKALNYGFNCLTDNELIALIIKSAHKGSNVFMLADDILNKAGCFDNLLSLTYEELISIKGIKKAKALEILAILEICKRLTKADKVSDYVSSLNPKKLVDYIRFNIGFNVQEEFFVIFVNGSGKIIQAITMYKGTDDKTYVGVDEILRKALLLKAKGILIAHNHPSGVANPSSYDIELTKTINKGCKHVGINFIDHIIVTSNNYYSFKTNGLLVE